ncbi:MAG: DNA topoisomerase [Candidatus Bathyarchaeia archaeon]
MITTVIILTEKPDASRRIAEALAEANSLKTYTDENKVTYYEFKKNGKKHIVVCAVGHLFNLDPVDKSKGWTYPVFEAEWKPSFEVRKESEFSKKYFDVVKNMIANGSEFIVATDYDIEGDVIAYNILRFLANANDARRMVFSTLTKDELIESYKNMREHLNFSQVEAGLTRHYLDFLWGINITRALTLALKNHAKKGFAILSSGRVQSPTLAILFNRELEIRKFKPKPYWELELHVKLNGTQAIANYEKGRIWKKEEADKILQTCKGKDAKIKDIKKKKYKQAPPIPFNTTDLQAEAYQQFKFSPQQTMSIAESLYQQGFISYPRSSVDYDEKIFIIDSNNQIKEVKIGEFTDELIEKNYEKVVRVNDSEELDVNNYRTFTVNLKTNKIEIKPIDCLIRHTITEPLLELTTEDGRKVRVTRSHSVFVFENGELKSMPTSELNVGDYIAIAKSLPFSSNLKEINLLKKIKGRGLEKEFTLVNWKVNEGLLNQTYGKDHIYNDYRFGNSIPLSSALNFISANEISPDTRVKAFSGKNEISLKIIQKVTPFLARLLGYFSSEGCKWKVEGEKASYEVNFTQQKNEVLEDMKVCLKEVLGLNVREGGKGNVKRLRVHGKTPYYLLELFDATQSTLTKKVPEIILSAPDEIVSEYLKAYFAGDGWVDTHARSVCARTISKDLANGIIFLLLRLGIFARIYEAPPKKKAKYLSYEIEITGNDDIRKFYEKVGFIKKSHYKKAQKILNMKKLSSSVHIDAIPRSLINWKELVKGLYQVIKKYTKVHGTKFITIKQLKKIAKIKTNDYLIKILKFLESDVGLSKIVSIKEVKPTNNYVYDLSIKSTNYENFVGGFGSIILHNSSQKLPPSINYERILKALASLPPYKKFAEELLKKEKLAPIEGKKEDPAHPAVYASWELPDLSKLNSQQKKIYDLIARRTLAAFGDEALRETNTVSLDVAGHTFLLVGKRTLEHGWTKIYEPYLKMEEIILPDLKAGQIIKVIKLEELAKETQPPARYSQGSIIKELEARNLGTRCIAGDVKIPILNNQEFHEIEVERLFDEKNSLANGDESISFNSHKMCFCVNEKNLMTSKFDLISRRKLDKNEKVFEIIFKDGSKIKLTEEHPILVYDKNTLTYVPVKNLSKGAKVCSTFLFYDKFGEVITLQDFVKKLNLKSKLYGHLDLKEWRKSKNLNQKDFGKLLGVGQATVVGWEKKKLIPLWVWSKVALPPPEIIYSNNKKVALQNPFPVVFSSSLVRILAHLIGDGSLDREKLKKENCFGFRYTNKNLELVKLFISDVEKIFKTNKKIREMERKNKFYVKLPAVIGMILGILFKELISKKIDIDEKFYPDFIGAIFDDEGHFYKKEVKIFISNTNLYLIKNLEKYLKRLGFTPYVREENQAYRKEGWAKSYKIFLYGRDVARFLEIIPFFHRSKKERIIENLTKNYRYLNKPYLLLEKKVFASLPKDGATSREISLNTGLPLFTVLTCLKNLRKQGYVGVKIVGISQQPRKKIIYIPLKECCKTFYSLLEEKVLSLTLFTKTVESSMESNYNGYVYDITNSLTSNFVLGNNIVVHNSTRSEILQTLYDRGYIAGKSIQVTKLGEAVVQALKEYCPKILSEELTRKFEEEMELVYQDKKKREEVIEEARKTLKEILEEFKANEKKIGKKLSEALLTKREEERKIGNCPKCKTGELRILRSKLSGKFFVGCSNYPNCKTGYPLPAGASIQSTGKTCEKCNTPIIQVFRKGKRPFRMCLLPSCITKSDWNKNKNKSNTLKKISSKSG